MQLSVFSTDNEKSGFRLQYMEVFNWGTFDEQIHTITPNGETSLLTGANGSGKTTFVDALLTLIVPEKDIAFTTRVVVVKRRVTERKILT
ncbi:ATP-binding protein [Niabella hibiscisoli]|uniref:ATP-binding protein n=1 Tax=Niabella hibiscisoli TaxID=1825928 RepID=UPI001F107C63|nr:ATP-binding protein [Niabella hibiscisoli]MCH5719922.1 AAA family ATPase [Niabella hibiscisoli]